MHKLIESVQGKILCNSLKYEKCKDCITQNVNDLVARMTCPFDNNEKRIGKKTTKSGTLYICNPNHITTKNFKITIEETASCIPNLLKTALEVEEFSKQQIEKKDSRLMHNLRNISAHLNQELYFLQDPSTLYTDRRHIDRIEERITMDVRKVALKLLRIQKYAANFKAELSVHDKLNSKNPELRIEKYGAYSLLKSVLYDFFSDFHSKNIYVEMDNSFEKIMVDYETFKVAIYHIFENAVKYALNDTNIKITFVKHSEDLRINISMESLMINPEELPQIFIEGYSGDNAKKSKLAGKGIGMYRCKQMLELINCSIKIDPGRHVQDYKDDLPYAHNLFIIEAPLWRS